MDGAVRLLRVFGPIPRDTLLVGGRPQYLQYSIVDTQAGSLENSPSFSAKGRRGFVDQSEVSMR